VHEGKIVSGGVCCNRGPQDLRGLAVDAVLRTDT
jgi:hypothetical protein